MVGGKGPIDDRSSPHKQQQRLENDPPLPQSVEKPAVTLIQRNQTTAAFKNDHPMKANLPPPSKKVDSRPPFQKTSKKVENGQTPEDNYITSSMNIDLSPPTKKADSQPSSQKDSSSLKTDKSSQTYNDNHPTSSLQDDLTPVPIKVSSRPASEQNGHTSTPKIVYERLPSAKDDNVASLGIGDPSPLVNEVSARKENYLSAPTKGDNRSPSKNENRESLFHKSVNDDMQKTAPEGKLGSMDDISSWGNQDDAMALKRGSPNPLDAETKVEKHT
ncbi:hypothetical protein Aperf_G00000125244 [Anoplocephala perfoliata]